MTSRSTVEKGGTTSFLRGVRQEMKKVQWPTKSELVRYTIIVLVTVVFISLLIMTIDFVFAWIYRLFTSLV